MPLNPADPHDLRFVITDVNTASPNVGEFFALSTNNASGIPIPAFRTGAALPPAGAMQGQGFFVTTSRRGYVWDGANWQDVTPNPIKSYADDATLLAAVDPAGSYATTQDTGNLYVRLATAWKQLNIRQFANYAALIADTDAPLQTVAELTDEGSLWERKPPIGGGGGAGGGTPAPPLGASGTASNWTSAIAEPAMTPGQVGLWLDVTADLGFTGFPMTLATAKTITVNMSDGSTRTITVPAKNYPDSGATDGGSAAAVNGLGWQMFYDGLPAPIVGTMPIEDGTTLWLRVDVADNATVYPVATAVTAGATARRWVATSPRELPNLAAIQAWTGDVGSNVGDQAVAMDTGIHYTRLASGWRPDGIYEATEAVIRASTPINGQEAYATDTQKRLVYLGGQWVEDPIQHYPTDAILQAATPPDGTLAWADDTAKIYARAGGAWIGATTGFADPIPIGTISAFPTNAVPTGWLKCDGSAVPAGPNYAELRTLLGAGNNLPDLRGEFLRGAKAGDTPLDRHQWSTGRPRTPFTTDDPGDHEHWEGRKTYGPQPELFLYKNRSLGTTGWVSSNTNNLAQYQGSTSTAGHHTHTVNGGGDAETAPDHVLVVWCIKAAHSTIIPPVFANNLNAPTDGQVLTFNGTTNQWENRTNVAAGFNPTITTPADGEAIVYDGATSTWVNKTAAMRTQTITQAAYDALHPKDPATLYLING